MMRCRFCGSTSLHSDTQHKTFSSGKAVAGAVVFGPVGAAAGFIGKEKQGYRCGACGNYMDLPMDTFTGMQIDDAINAAKKGNTTLYTYYKNQYPNIETVTVQEKSPAPTPVERAINAPMETLGQEETVKRSYRYGIWSPDAPVYIESVILKTDGKEDRMSLVAWNQSGKEIRSLYLNVVVFDDTGDEVSRCRCVYQNMTKDEDEPKRLPVDKTFPLNTDVAYRVQIEQEKAAFEDGSTWRTSETDKVYTLPEQPVLTEKNFPRIQYVHSKYAFIKFHPLRGQPKPKIRLNMPMQEADFWMCDCGHPAKKNNPCPYCRNEYWALEKLYSQKTLLAEQQKAVRMRAEERTKKMLPKYEQLVEAKETAEKDAKYWSAQRLMQSRSIPDIQKAKSILAELSGWRDAAEIMTNCDRKIEQIKAQEKKDQEEAERRAAEEAKRQEEDRILAEHRRRKAKTVGIIIGIVVAVAVIIAVLTFMFFIPNANYNKAIDLYNAGQFEDAITAFEASNGFKDSEAQIDNCKYYNALALFNAGKYEKAISAFEELNGYKDSVKQIEACQTAIKDQQYDAAVDLLQAEKYEAAIQAFHAINGYKDSASQIEVCQTAIKEREYDSAVALYNAGQYEEAISAFETLNGYKDSTTQIELCNTAIKEMEYNSAIALYEAGKYAEAIWALNALKEYKESLAYITECWNHIAVRNTIAAGADHTVGLKENGTVVATKHIGKSYLYHGQSDVSDWKDIIAIQAYSDHTIGLMKDGYVVVAGIESNVVSDWRDIVAVAVGTSYVVGLKTDGTVIASGSDELGQCKVEEWEHIVAIDAGYGHTVGLKANGIVVTAGLNRSGQCNVSKWNDIICIDAGGFHTVGLKSDGSVVAVGRNDSDQCNVSDWKDIVAITAGGFHTVGLRSDGTVVAVGSNSSGQCEVSKWTDIVAIAAGLRHTVGLRSNGTVVVVGDKTSGQCNVSNWKGIKTPERNGN